MNSNDYRLTHTTSYIGYSPLLFRGEGASQLQKTKKITNQIAPDSVQDLLPWLKKLYAQALIEIEKDTRPKDRSHSNLHYPSNSLMSIFISFSEIEALSALVNIPIKNIMEFE
uniref:hypothetical protein n=1 Tax=Algoriphagus locisalis TaxID=305507 RepID=UPI000B818AD8|nr:hypothetical protein [Algoriphagus locisalis]